MNPANHGQCHIRRSSRDERHEDLKGEEREEAQTGVGQEAAEGTEQPHPRHELEGMAQVLQSQSVPEVKVVGPEVVNQESRYGSVSSGLTSECGHLEDSTTTNTTGLLLPSVTPNRMRRRLKFFFMNPIEKWHARRRFPWKLLLQVFKIVVVTAQLCLFAQQRYSHVDYLWDTKISFSHLFIKGWDSTREIQVYPPGTGALAVYEKQEFYQYLDFAIIAYASINDKAIGTYSYKYQDGELVMPTLCNSHYAGGHVFLNNNTYMLNDNITTSCIDIPVEEVNATDWSSEAYLEQNNFTINFDLLLNTEFTFHLRTIKLRVNLPFDTPECYGLTGKLVFNNHDHDGQMVVDLDLGAQVLECHGSVMLVSEARTLKVWRMVINITSIMICVISLIMCVRAMYRAQLLRKATEIFFTRHYGKELSFEERMEFVNLWYLLICINDILIILGSFLKIGLESKSYEGYLDTWNVCSLFLGLGNLLVWFGCLRYLGFFTTYNVLILTMKKCIPNVLRFSICLMMVFAGYCLCGWLVLGPYHLKFRSFSSTMECLYSLINGDDMFATFSSTSGKDPVVWWFSRIYLYTFISLFIYVILSLFIAIIMDAYETIKAPDMQCILSPEQKRRQVKEEIEREAVEESLRIEKTNTDVQTPTVTINTSTQTPNGDTQHYYDAGFPLNDLMKFVQECTEEPSSGVFQDEGDHTIHDVINSICCCGYESSHQSTEYESFLT